MHKERKGGIIEAYNYKGDNAVCGLVWFQVELDRTLPSLEMTLPLLPGNSAKQVLLIAYFGDLPAVCELHADSHQSDIGTIWSSGWFPTMWSMKLRQPEGLK